MKSSRLPPRFSVEEPGYEATILVHNTEKPQHSLVRVWCLNPKSMHDVYVHDLQSVVIALVHIVMVIYFL